VGKKKELDLRVRRDDDGKLFPLVGVSPTLGIEVEIVPLTYGESRSYPSFRKALNEWSDEEKCRLISEHVVKPNVLDKNGELTVEDMLENFDAWTVEDLVQAVAVYSGLSRLFETEPSDGTEGNVDGEATT
jgi:hypothetical protein